MGIQHPEKSPPFGFVPSNSSSEGGSNDSESQSTGNVESEVENLLQRTMAQLDLSNSYCRYLEKKLKEVTTDFEKATNQLERATELLERKPPPPPPVKIEEEAVWEYFDKKNRWCAYPNLEDQRCIESLYQEAQRAGCQRGGEYLWEVKASGAVYVVDVVQGTQTRANHPDKKIRAVRRRTFDATGVVHIVDAHGIADSDFGGSSHQGGGGDRRADPGGSIASASTATFN